MAETFRFLEKAEFDALSTDEKVRYMKHAYTELQKLFPPKAELDADSWADMAAELRKLEK